MKIEFNSQEEYELFRRVMDAVKNQPQTPAQAMPGAGVIPFNLGQEHELIHKPETGAARFSHSIPAIPPVVSNSGFPYGSTKWLWGVDITTVKVDDVDYPAVKIGAGAVVVLRSDNAGDISSTFYYSVEKTLQIDMNYSVQYVRWDFSQNGSTPLDVSGPYETPTRTEAELPVFGVTGIGPLFKLITPGSISSRIITGVIPMDMMEGVIRLRVPILPTATTNGNSPKWSTALNEYYGD